MGSSKLQTKPRSSPMLSMKRSNPLHEMCAWLHLNDLRTYVSRKRHGDEHVLIRLNLLLAPPLDNCQILVPTSRCGRPLVTSPISMPPLFPASGASPRHEPRQG